MKITEIIKRDIDLVQFALSHNFEIDRKKSSKKCKVLRGDSIRKINVSKNGGQWVFYDCDARSGGSIIDFYMAVEGVDRFGAISFLESQIGIEQPNHDPIYSVKESSFDRERVKEEISKMIPLQNYHWFLGYRGITRATISAARFDGTLYTDDRKNILFPHKDRKGYTGSEKKNRGYASFTEYGKKSLWFSRSFKEDYYLVFSESGLDILSRFQLKDNGCTQYFSFGGNLSEEQFDLIASVFKKNPWKKKVLSPDNDKAGREYVDMFKERFPDETFIVDLPGVDGQDWNDLVKSRQPSLF